MQKSGKVFVSQHGHAVCESHAGHYLSYVLTEQPGLCSELYKWEQFVDDKGNTVDVIDTPLHQWKRSNATDWPTACDYCQ